MSGLALPTPEHRSGERAAFGLALAAHVALFAALSLAWGPQAKREWPKAEPLEVSLVKDVALEATAPPAPEPPAPSIAREQGLPDDAPPAAPQPVARPEPAKSAPVQPALQPKPAPAAKPAPAKPQPVAAKPAPAKAAPPPRTSRLAGLQQELAAGAKADAAAARPRGRRLGENFLAGLFADATQQKASAAAPGKAGSFPAASIRQAIARQIQPCADRQVNPGPGANQIVTKLNIRLNPDGTLAAIPRMVSQTGADSENERYAQRVVDLGIAAFKGCSPFKLPTQYYSTPEGGWNNINYEWKLK